MPGKSSGLPQLPVVRVIRCLRTGRYFTGQDWTSDPSHAQAFPDEAQAIRTCVHHRLVNVELVVRIPGFITDLCTVRLG